MDRRNFLTTSASCGAHVLSLACLSPMLTRRVFAAQKPDKVVAEEKWGRLEKVADNAWALISTPFSKRDYTTVCNGGIIAGDKGVLAIESFASDKGATWMAEQAKQLTGRWPTDVVSTHHHGDHTGGHAGYFKDEHNPKIWLTESTKKTAEKSFKRSRKSPFKNVSNIPTSQNTTIDLGNRIVNLIPRSGHTASDVTIELVDPKIVWCGDLFFNRMFPNYSHATPSKLNTYASSIIEAPDVTYIPGHGPIADADALKKYKDFLKYIQDAATKEFKAGKKVAEAAKAFKLPKEFSEWFIWNPSNAQLAYTAWYRELESDKAAD